MGFITGQTIVSQQASSSATPTTDDRAESFADKMIDLSTGMDLLIDRLHHALDMGSNLGADYGEDGAYVVEAITETRWIAQRLSEDISAVGREFNAIRPEAAE
jgi:hypothetical protein